MTTLPRLVENKIEFVQRLRALWLSEVRQESTASWI
jgi:hypothetical protein